MTYFSNAQQLKSTMRPFRLTLISFIFFFSFKAYSTEWIKVEIDSFASFEMPGYPQIINFKNSVKNAYALKTDSFSLSVIASGRERNMTAGSQKELDSFYFAFINGGAKRKIKFYFKWLERKFGSGR